MCFAAHQKLPVTALKISGPKEPRLQGERGYSDPRSHPRIWWCFKHTIHEGNARPHVNGKDSVFIQTDFAVPTWMCTRELWLLELTSERWSTYTLGPALYGSQTMKRQIKDFTNCVTVGVCVTFDLPASSQSFLFFISHHRGQQYGTHRTVWLY